MKYNHFSMLPEKAFQPRNGRLGMTLEGGSGGGGGGGVQEQYISTAPKQFLPYVERALGKTEALTETPYQTYGGERLAGPTQEQLAARSGVASLGTPGQFKTATDIGGEARRAALQAGQYDPTSFAADQVSAGDLTQFQAGAPAEVSRGLGSFTEAGTADKFMSPYMQQVVDAEKQAATREAQMAQTQANLAAGRRSGALGSSAQALGQAERERGLLDRLSGIQSRGSQAAFDQAQKAFEAEQARGLQAGLQTQQLGTQTDLANLQAKLGVQQLGAQTSLEAQRANQQAMLEAQRMAEQSRQYGAGLGLQGAQALTGLAGTMGNLGSAQQEADLARLGAQEQFGGMGQREQQQRMDLAYQDFMAQQRHPYQQLEFMRSMISGTPIGQAQTMYQAPQSQMQNLMQLGLGGLGLYGAYGGFR